MRYRDLVGPLMIGRRGSSCLRRTRWDCTTSPIVTYALIGSPGPTAHLRRDASAQLWLDSEPVLAASVWGSRVGLTLTDRTVLLDAGDYWHLLRAADAEASRKWPTATAAWPVGAAGAPSHPERDAVAQAGSAQALVCADGELCTYLPALQGGASTPQQTAIPATPTRDPALCDPSYPTVCIPPPDLNCTDIPYRGCEGAELASDRVTSAPCAQQRTGGAAAG